MRCLPPETLPPPDHQVVSAAVSTRTACAPSCVRWGWWKARCRLRASKHGRGLFRTRRGGDFRTQCGSFHSRERTSRGRALMSQNDPKRTWPTARWPRTKSRVGGKRLFIPFKLRLCPDSLKAQSSKIRGNVSAQTLRTGFGCQDRLWLENVAGSNGRAGDAS